MQTHFSPDQDFYSSHLVGKLNYILIEIVKIDHCWGTKSIVQRGLYIYPIAYGGLKFLGELHREECVCITYEDKGSRLPCQMHC